MPLLVNRGHADGRGFKGDLGWHIGVPASGHLSERTATAVLDSAGLDQRRSGSGKSTIAAALAQDSSMTLALDVDAIKHLIGRWDEDRLTSGLQARR
jgi:hypothetical protein